MKKILIILTILVIINYIFTPLGADQRIFFAYIQQVDDYYNGDLINTWMIRGIGYKIITYFIYKLTKFFVSYDDKMIFEMVCKLIYTLFTLSLLFFSFWISKNTLTHLDLNFWLIFYIICVSLFTVSFDLSYQAEDITVIIVLASFGMSLGSKFWNILAGILLSSLFTLKGITLGLGLIPIIILWMYKDQFKKNLIYLSLSFIFFNILLFILLFLFAKQEFIDLYNATLFQSSLVNNDLWERTQLFYQFPAMNFFHIPFLIIGIIYGLFLFVYYVDKNLRMCLGYILLWILPYLIIITQNRFYSYHYQIFMPTIIFTWIIILHYYGKFLSKSYWKQIILIFPSIFFILFTSPIGVFSVTRSISFYQESKVEAEQYKKINEKLEIFKESEILYLSDGRCTYYFKSKSYSKYFYPLPIKRSIHNPNLLKTNLYKDELEKFLNYRGHLIIVMDKWFELWNFPIIEEKIKEEYPIWLSKKIGRYWYTFYYRTDEL